MSGEPYIIDCAQCGIEFAQHAIPYRGVCADCRAQTLSDALDFDPPKNGWLLLY